MFGHDRRCWSYDIAAIAQAMKTDNVVDLMSRQIQCLALRTQRAITLAACVGNRFDLHTLAVVSMQAAEDRATDLQQAIEW